MRMNFSRGLNLLRKLERKEGTDVTLKWSEWPDGKPTADPTTGASLATEDSAPVQKSLLTKALVHYVTPATSSLRVHAEVEIGDCILEIFHDFVQVTDPGDTALVDGSIVDSYTVAAANRALADDDDPAASTVIDIANLDNAYFEIDGQRWVQKKIGDKLIKSWDAIIGNRKFARSYLLTKAV